MPAPPDPVTVRGDTVARAKRIDRAEARRRYRQTLAAEGADTTAADDTTASDDTSARPAKRAPTPPKASGATASPGARPSVTMALRMAAQPADIRADIAALPYLALHTKALWLPLVLTVASGIVFVVLGPQKNMVAVLAFQAFVVPPPMAASFLGGILAPRASWLVGGIIGVAASVAFAAVALVYPDSSGVTGAVGEASQRQAAVFFGFVVSPGLGIAIGAFAGFYRRFLRFSNPAGQQRSSKSSRQRRGRR
jgi:uncharacterized membrane protein